MFDDRYETRSEYNLMRHVFFSVMNNLLQRIMLFVGGLILLTHSPTYISTSVIKSYKNYKSFKHAYILLSLFCPSEFSH